MGISKWADQLGWGEEQFEALRNTGYSYLKEGKYEKAQLFFESLVILNPESLYDLQTLGALHLQTNENEKALEVLNIALEKDPSHEPTLLNKVKALLMLGQIQEGFKIAQKLQKSSQPQIADTAEALILAYS